MRTVLLVSVALLLAACPDPAKNKPKAEVAPAPAPAAAPVAERAQPLAGAAAYAFSQADSKLLWTGAKVTAKHEGGFNAFSGLIEVVEGDPARSRVRVDIELGSVWTDSDKLVEHLKSADFFDVAQHARATFVSTALEKKEAGWAVTGTLSLHGVEKQLTFPANITLGEGTVTVTADFAINRKDFGIVYPGRPDNLIADDVAVKLELNAKKKG